VKRTLEWQIATVKAIRQETANVKTLTLALLKWVPHRPGQHYDIRLTAEDGYSAQRSYSIGSEPERHGEIDITVERIRDGEVSPFLDDVVVVGDRFEVRGPIGGYFVWEASDGGPLLLVAGGSGIVPLMAMARHRAAVGATVPARLLYSSRSFDDIIYRADLDALANRDGLQVFHTLTLRPEGAGVHLRADRARRDGRGCGGGGGRRGGAHQDRALRSDRRMTMESERDLMLDGNAAAGVLQEIFGEEMTTALTTCDECATGSEMAMLRVFSGGPGLVLRCPACEAVMVRIAQTPHGTFVDVRGVRQMRLPLPSIR